RSYRCTLSLRVALPISIGRIARRRCLERLAEERLRIDSRARLLVEPGERIVERVDRAPVAHHETLVAPVLAQHFGQQEPIAAALDRKSTRLNSSHVKIS